MVAENKGKEVIVPLNDGVYVSGQLEIVDKVLVDIGTGYYMEKVVILSNNVLYHTAEHPRGQQFLRAQD